ncbi:LOW QUALITY PROTEIN: Sec34-like family-domain-containing protein, partial [Jimgerdemannia flammicorona]
ILVLCPYIYLSWSVACISALSTSPIHFPLPLHPYSFRMAAATRPTRGMTLEEWESKTQLTDAQKQTVLEIQDACAELPLPDAFLEDKVNSPTPYLRTTRSPDPATQSPATAKHIARLGASPIPRSRSTTNLLFETTTAADAAAAETATALGISEPIETTQQFFDWFAQMEAEMERDQEDVYRYGWSLVVCVFDEELKGRHGFSGAIFTNYLAIVTLYRQACDEFLEQINTTANLFVDLDGNFRYVEERTRALQLACEKLLQEQDHLTALADSISSKLAYFNQLETITKMFNAPGEHVVLQDEFVPMLEKLDECLEYVQGNLKYRDSELYLMRFRQCMTRGMTLIKMYFITTLRGLGLEVSKKASTKAPDQPMNPTTQSTLFYVKFRTAAPKLKALVHEIEKRCPDHREYYALLNDCYNAYFTVRQSLLNQVVGAKILELGPRGEDLLAFVVIDAWSSVSFGRPLTSSIDPHRRRMGALGRRRTLWIPRSPSELLVRLPPSTHYSREPNRGVIRDLQHLPDSPDSGYGECGWSLPPLNIFHHGSGSEDGQDQGLAFSYLIRHVLQDAQQRLIFRAQSYIRTEIQVFMPKPEDLDYPAKLRSLRRSSILSQPTSTRSISFPTAVRQSDGPATLTVEEDGSETMVATDGDTSKPTSWADTTTADATTVASPTLSQRPLSLYNANVSSLTSTDPSITAEMYKGWYPTLQRTLWILSKLYRCVKVGWSAHSEASFEEPYIPCHAFMLTSYPVGERAILLQTSVFEDLSQEAVSLCRQSLSTASESITAKQVPSRSIWCCEQFHNSCVWTAVSSNLRLDIESRQIFSFYTRDHLPTFTHWRAKSKVDGQLFLIKHLLILKEQIAPFEANFVHSARGLDFSAVLVLNSSLPCPDESFVLTYFPSFYCILDAYNAITQGKASIFNPNSLFSLAQKGIPRVVEINADSKREVDKELKRVCEEFILETVKAAVEPVASFLLKVSAFRLRNDLKPVNQKLLLREQPFALQGESSIFGRSALKRSTHIMPNVAEIADAFRESVRSRLTFAMARLSEYLSDRKTEIVLLKPMQVCVHKIPLSFNLWDCDGRFDKCYRAFYDTVQYEYDLSTFTREVDSVEETAEWVNKVIEEGPQGGVLDSNRKFNK